MNNNNKKKNLRELSKEDKMNELMRYYASEMSEDAQDGSPFDVKVFNAIESVVKVEEPILTGGRKSDPPKRPQFFPKYFVLKMSQKIDLIKFFSLFAVSTGHEIKVFPPFKEDSFLLGSNFAELLLESIVTEKTLCPVCNHPLDMHYSKETEIWLGNPPYTDENKRKNFHLICNVPNCNANPKQGVCFSSIPDEILGDGLSDAMFPDEEPTETSSPVKSLDSNFENETPNGVFSIRKKDLDAEEE